MLLVEFSSLQIFKARLDGIWSNLGWWKMDFKVLFNPTPSMIL